jgi:hypothetical protein
MDLCIRVTDINAYQEAELREKIHIWLLDYYLWMRIMIKWQKVVVDRQVTQKD